MRSLLQEMYKIFKKVVCCYNRKSLIRMLHANDAVFYRLSKTKAVTIVTLKAGLGKNKGLYLCCKGLCF